MAVTRHSDAVAPVRSSGPLSTWFMRHVSTSIGSLGRLVRQPFASLMIILVIAVTLAIPAALNLVVKNAQAISAGWDNALDFSIYLRRNVTESEAEGLARLIGQRSDVQEEIDRIERLIERSAAKIKSILDEGLDRDEMIGRFSEWMVTVAAEEGGDPEALRREEKLNPRHMSVDGISRY